MRKKRNNYFLPKPAAEFETWIGIDTGVNTGVARAENGRLVEVFSAPILDAMEYCLKYPEALLRIEDARQMIRGDRRGGAAGIARAQGAGSIKRDAQIWEDFATKHGFAFVMQAPKRGAIKLNAARFKKITGWKGRTNEHARDAAMLVARFRCDN